MKHAIFYLLLAILPGNLLSTTDYSHRLSGLWANRYGDITLEIKSWRKGIKVRQRSAYDKGKWRKYYRMGYGVFDDCKGRVVIVERRGLITWRNNRRGRSIRLHRYDDFNRGYGDDRFRRSRDRYDYESSSRSNRSRRSDYYTNDYIGNWYCSERDLDLEIIVYGTGFRARRPRGDWIYYDRVSNNRYHDRNGNSYYMDNGELYWESSNRRNRLKFSKR